MQQEDFYFQKSYDRPKALVQFLSHINLNMNHIFIIIIVLSKIITCFEECNFNFFPIPQQCTIGNEERLLENPCYILYRVNTKSEGNTHIKQILDHYQQKTFRCSSANVMFIIDQDPQAINAYQYIVEINIEDSNLRSVFNIEQESYQISVSRTKSVIKAQTYVGFIRGLQTLTQIPQCSAKIKSCNLQKLPIQIKDHPQFVYRGVMIDTSRHFLPVELILQTIDALMYNKMNVLHWHITDQDSFPLILDSHPQIAKYGAFSDEETYTSLQARQIVKYALIRGVRVIPQLDTPAHAASWGKAPQYKDIVCSIGGGYMGSLDVTMDKTYVILKQIFTEIDSIFIDPIIHLGGDEASLACLKNKTQVMAKQNVPENSFEIYYRRRQKKIIREININKTPMYWMNNANKIHMLEQNDISHWWGGDFPPTNTKVVLSNYGSYYLDLGASSGNYITWLDFYNKNIQKEMQNYSNKHNVLGAQACLWSEVSNKYTHHIKIWIRTSSLAQRLWNSKITKIKPGVTRRITAHQRLMNKRGIPTSPATCQQCEFNSFVC